MLKKYSALEFYLMCMQVLGWLLMVAFFGWVLSMLVRAADVANSPIALNAVLWSLLAGAAATLPSSLLLLGLAEIGKVSLDTRRDLARITEQQN